MNFKLGLLCGIVVPCSMAILACGNDCSSNASASDNGVGSGFIGEKIPIVLDEANRSITAYSTRKENRCVVENESYEFVTETQTSQSQRNYTFVGDTLVLLYSDEGHTYGQVYVGGKSDQVKSKWKLSTCHYADDSIDCSDAADANLTDGSSFYYTFTQDTLYISRIDAQGNAIDIYAPDVDDYDDYAGSEFVQEVFMHLESYVSGNTLAPWSAFEKPWYGDGRIDIDSIALKMNVTIVSRDKNHISFVYDGASYELNFTHAFHQWYNSGSRVELDVTLTSDKGNCSLSYIGDVIDSPEICSAEHAQDLELATFYSNNDSLLFYGAKDYHVGNHEEFISCLHKLNGAPDLYQLYKKSR